MRLVLFALMSLCAACFMMPRAVIADGKVFMSLAEDPNSATMPDQQALIYYKDGVQTLVIETRFVGTAGNFAWVVPLPAPPEVAPATTGLFKTLRAMHQPKIERRAGSLTPPRAVPSEGMNSTTATKRSSAAHRNPASRLRVARMMSSITDDTTHSGVSEPARRSIFG